MANMNKTKLGGKMTVQFKDLSGWLKTAVVVSLIELGFYTIAFLIGFFSVF